MVREKGNWLTRWKIEKYLNEEDYKNNKPYQIDEFEGNLLLDEGINEIWQLVTGLGGTAYSNANAQLGVGNSSVATASTQTDLQGASTAWVGMDSGYPSVSGNVVTFKATFDGNTGNFAWEEFSVRNGATANKNLNRRVISKGTKSAGEVWTLTLEIELN